MRPAIALALLLATEHAQAADAPPAPAIDSIVWQARFEAWVEDALVRGEVERAAQTLPARDGEASARLLDELELEAALHLPDASSLPAPVIPRLAAPSLRGDAIQAARLWAEGQREAALARLDRPALAADPGAAHLRAQLADVPGREAHARVHLDTIEGYRAALRVSRTVPEATRARLRIGQLYLGIRFHREGRAALEPLLAASAQPSEAPLDVRVSLAEARYLDRDPGAALELIDTLPLGEVEPSVRSWALRRRADALHALARWPQAEEAYAAALQADAEQPTAALRLAHAALRAGEPQRARAALEGAVSAMAPEHAALGHLLLARAHREAGELDGAIASAARAAELGGEEPVAALATAESLRARELRDGSLVGLSEADRSRGAAPGSSDAAAYLAYRIASQPDPEGTPGGARERLGRLLLALPSGPVRHVVHDELAHAMVSALEEAHRAGLPPEPALLDEFVRVLTPVHMDLNALLLAVQGFARAGQRERCARWARVLYRREERPIRRGLAAWKDAVCRGTVKGDAEYVNRLTSLADTGDTGPFGLPIAALGAEQLVRYGDLVRAVTVYERALLSLAEPRLLGPALLRLGELQVASGRSSLGVQRLVRGLSLTDADETAADPLRKAGILALARASAPKRAAEQLERVLRRERERADPWWSSAYAFLGWRAGVLRDVAAGPDLFGRGMQEIALAGEVAGRARAHLAEKRPRAGGSP